VPVSERENTIAAQAVNVGVAFQVCQRHPLGVVLDVVEPADFEQSHLGRVDELLILLDDVLCDAFDFLGRVFHRATLAQRREGCQAGSTVRFPAFVRG